MSGGKIGAHGPPPAGGDSKKRCTVTPKQRKVWTVAASRGKVKDVNPHLQRRGHTILEPPQLRPHLWRAQQRESDLHNPLKQSMVKTSRHRHHRQAYHLSQTLIWTKRIRTRRLPQQTTKPRRKGQMLLTTIMIKDQHRGDE